MEYVIPIFAGLILLFLMTRPFMIFFHELGHAIPSLLFTKDDVSIFIGSYGEENQSFKMQIGRLTIWLRYNPIKWRGGLCVFEGDNIPLKQHFIIFLCGPLLSFVIAIALSYVAFGFDLHSFLKLVCVFLLFSAVMDIIVSLNPRVLRQKDGRVFYTDGYVLFNIRMFKEFPKYYDIAMDYYNKKEYLKAGKLFEKFLVSNIVSEDIYRAAASSYIFGEKYEKAYSIQKQWEEAFEMDTVDYYNLAFTCIRLKNNESDIYLQKSLSLDSTNALTLNAIGYELTRESEFKEAINYLNKAIEADAKCSYAFNNRGYAKIELGELDAGLRDIEYSFELEKTNSYAYRNLGIYHTKKGNHSKALELLIKAKEMDKTTDLIDELIKHQKYLLKTLSIKR